VRRTGGQSSIYSREKKVCYGKRKRHPAERLRSRLLARRGRWPRYILTMGNRGDFAPQHKIHAALHFTFLSLLAYLGCEWLLTRIQSRKSIAVRHNRSSGLRGGEGNGKCGRVEGEG